jgi:hypothetical protein
MEMIRNNFRLILFLFLATHALNAQDSSQQSFFNQLYAAAEKEYGIDQELLNGPLFENRNQDVSGLPYLFKYYTDQGNVIYRGKQYSNLNLRYDIYNQQLLLIYPSDSVEYKLHLQKEFITEFEIEKKRFINEAFGTSGDAKFYQVLGQDFPICILYYWKKGLSNVYVNNPDVKMYSPEEKESFILLNNKLVNYSGNRSFTRHFSSNHKTAITKYFRQNNTKVNEANDTEMEQLIEFINLLEN